MCLTISIKKFSDILPKRAKQDIPVYKVLEHTTKDGVTSIYTPYRGNKIKFRKGRCIQRVFRFTGALVYSHYDFCSPTTGLFGMIWKYWFGGYNKMPYLNTFKAIYAHRSLIEAASSIYALKASTVCMSDYHIYAAIIPKGAYYYSNHSDICATKMIIYDEIIHQL